jgi:hypothetical protein
MQRTKKICYVVAATLGVGGIASADKPKAADDTQDETSQDQTSHDQPSQDQTSQDQSSEVMASKMTAKATIAKIDKAKRQVTLRDDEGHQFKVNVPEDVAGFDQIKKGEKVGIEYYQSVTLELKRGDKSKDKTEDTSMQSRTPGPLPGGMKAHMVSATVQVVKVDSAANKLTIKAPSGETDTIDVTDPALQADLAKLKKGDKIKASYTEAVAVSVMPQDKQAEKSKQPQRTQQPQQPSSEPKEPSEPTQPSEPKASSEPTQPNQPPPAPPEREQPPEPKAPY